MARNLGTPPAHAGNRCPCGNITKTKYCSHKCYSAAKIGEKHSWGNKISIALKGKPKSKTHIENVRQTLIGRKRLDMSGPKNINWKGDRASYGTLHDWVSLHLGRPKSCTHCKSTDPQKKYQWANISGKYKRDLTDWIRLCVQCHRKMDKNIPRASLLFVKKGKRYREMK